MKTKIEKLQSAIKNNRGNIKTSLIELCNTGFTKTGKSGYSKGWASKFVWTVDISIVLRRLNIKFESGNNAPKGGANGEYIKLTDKTLLKQISVKNRIENERKEKELQEKAEAERIRAEELKNYINTLPINEQFEQIFLSSELKNQSGLSWREYRENLKTQYPEEWSLLKAKFKAQNEIHIKNFHNENN